MNQEVVFVEMGSTLDHNFETNNKIKENTRRPKMVKRYRIYRLSFNQNMEL